MVHSLERDELDLRLTALDSQLSKTGIALRFRPLRYFTAIYGRVPDGDLRRKLFDSITEWFIGRYGHRARWDGIVGRIPVLLRGDVFLVQVPFVSELTLVKLTDRFEGMSAERGITLTEEEFAHLAPKIAAGTSHFFKLYNLTVDDDFSDDLERDLIWMAVSDLEIAATSVKSEDTRNSIFHSHAAAEKFLKVALKRSGFGNDLKSFGHNLPKLFSELATSEPRYAWLQSAVDLLQSSAPNMQIRYQMLPRTVDEAVSTFNSALNVCGTLAGIWIFDFERGSKQSNFVPGRFYRNWDRVPYYCARILNAADAGPLAMLTLFHIEPVTGESTIVELTMQLEQSSLFLEITDPSELRVVQQNYALQMRNKGKKVTPEEIGLRIASGPEGSYVTRRCIIEKRSEE